jgi:multidrug efflux system membrane fusion protein
MTIDANRPDSKQHTEDPEKLADAQRQRPRRRTIWITSAAAVILAIILVYHFRSHNTSSAPNKAHAPGQVQQDPAAITFGQSGTGDIDIYVEALGTVTPTYTVTVFSQITGRVMAVHYREGQMVRKGDPLADIDPRPYQATLTQAEGTLRRDQGVLAQARIDLERYRAAAAKNAIAKQQLDDQQQIVVQAEGAVQADEGTVAFDRVQLAYCHLVAPITGRVGLRLVDPGNTVFAGSNSTLVVITQLQPITVVFNVSEDDLPQVQAQLSTGKTLEVDAFDRAQDKILDSGKLRSVDNEVDTTTGTIKFRAEFTNKKLSLFPNQFVNARLRVRTLHNATLVPTVAVQHNGTSAFVYVVNSNNTVSVQPVTPLTGNEQETAVQGLNAGVTLATSGFDDLENGAPVIAQKQVANQQKMQGADGSSGGNSSQ